jgi:DNA polymerase III epsilon subunit-like protein
MDLSRYKNLVPESELHRDLERLLREHGGEAPAELICEQILLLAPHDPQLVTALVEGLVQPHPQLRLNGEGRVRWLEPDRAETWVSSRGFAVLDVETINGSRRFPRIIEIGICHVEEGEVRGEWSSLVNPDRPIPYWVRQLTGIRDADVEAAPRFAELLPRIAEELDQTILVAHHARFDVACLNAELTRSVGMRLANFYLCTVELARHFLPGSESYRLEALSQWLRLTHERPHRAASDARATAELFCHLLRTVEAPWSDYLRPRPWVGAAKPGKNAETNSQPIS